jgi:acetyltransferase-like isoleucine patch superfamily enzyme
VTSSAEFSGAVGASTPTRPVVPLPQQSRRRLTLANLRAMLRWLWIQARYRNAPRRLFYLGPGSWLEIGPTASMEFGSRVRIMGRLTLSVHGRLQVGANLHVNRDCSISTMESITIGRDCGIAEGCSIHDMTHCFGPEWSGVPFLERPFWTEPIVMGDNVWIGAHCTVVGGVTIGDDVVVAANSVVTRDLPSHCLAAGAPARVVRSWAADAPVAVDRGD